MHTDQKFISTLVRTAEQDGIQKFVVGALIYRNGKILLLERSASEFMGGLVELPSGGVEAGEDLIVALAREVLEETGLRIAHVDRYVGFFDYVSNSGKNTRQFNFVVEVLPGEVVIAPTEHERWYWIESTDEEFTSLHISKATRKIIQEVAKK